MKTRQINSLHALMSCALVALSGACLSQSNAAPAAGSSIQPAASASAAAKPKLDLSGRKRIGKASYYARKFTGRKTGRTTGPR